MLFDWIAFILAFLYGGLTGLGGIIQIRKKEIPQWSSFLMIIVGCFIIVSSLWILMFESSVLFLVLCLMLMHMIAVMNGLHLYGKINILHHLVRLFYSVGVVVLFMI